MLSDWRYAARTLRRSPAFTLVALASLALGIGANTAIFSVVHAVLLKPLPVPNPGQLRVLTTINSRGEREDGFSYPMYEHVRAANRVFDGVFASTGGGRMDSIELDGAAPGGGAVNADVRMVTGEYFSTLGVKPFAGRLLDAGDNRTGSPNRVAVLSYRFWRSRYAGDFGVLGRSLGIRGQQIAIAGIAPPGFFGHEVGAAPDLWVPAALQPVFDRGFSVLDSPNHSWMGMMVRLRTGLSDEQARAALEVMLGQFRSEGTRFARNVQNSVRRFVLEPGGRGVSGLRTRFSEPLRILMGIVALLLLIACANVANLLLARASGRGREMAIRRALGATRGRLLGQLLAESLLLACAGGALGILAASWGGQVLLRLVSDGPDPVPLDVTLDAGVLGFTLAVSLLTGLAFGLLPALAASRQERFAGLGSRSRVRASVARPLVAAQVAVSLLLLTAAGLFVRTLENLRHQDLGFAPQSVVQAAVSAGSSGYSDAQAKGLWARLRTRLEGLPGVLSVSMADTGFQWGSGYRCCIAVEGHLARPGEERRIAMSRVTPGYFETMGLAVVLGRSFEKQDVGASAAIVSESFARYYFGTGSPVGRRFGWGDPPAVTYDGEIVGVARDATWGDLRRGAEKMIYFPAAGGDLIEVRAAGDPSAMAANVRASLRAEDRNLRIWAIATLPDLRERAMTREKAIARLAGFFGGAALLLAGIGLYGVMAYSVARRRQEIGIRMALGARAGNVRWMVLREAGLLVVTGAVLGGAVAPAGGRLVASQLFGVTAADPWTVAAAAAFLLAVAGIAAYLPARRASRVDPMVALRHE